jgi:5-methylcytosine-specific restriction endonuclease McrA
VPRRRRRSSRYLSYIRSPAWFERRRKHLLKHGPDCKACGADQKIQLHHKTYDRLGAEKDADLVALCETCHKAVHAYARSHRYLTLWQATDHVVKRRRR